MALGYNTPYVDASLRLPSDKVSSCEVDTAEDNVLKTSFEAGLTNGLWPLFHRCLDMSSHTWSGLVSCKDIEYNRNFQIIHGKSIRTGNRQP